MQSETKNLRRLKRALVWFSVAALILGALPLYLIAPYNHPYYDDFGFAAGVHGAWKKTGSLSAVMTAAAESARTTYQTWQGTYTGTILSNLQPGLFDESLYFIGNLFLLTAFIGCFVYFLCVVFGALGMERTGRVSLACLAVALMLQCMPDMGEAFYWFNGGVGNTFIYSLLALSFALSLKLMNAQTRIQSAWLTLALAALVVLLGGGSYGGGLFGLCLYALGTVGLFRKRHPKKWHFLALTTLFLGCFLYSMAAPGNAVRATYIPCKSSAVKAVAQALYYGVAQMGSYLTLPLLAVSLAVAPLLYQAAKRSRFAFAHPWWVLLVFGALYCTQLTPPLYSGVHIGGGRIVNTYFISFVVLWLLYLYYLLGVLARRLKGRQISWSAKRFGALLLTSAVLLCVSLTGIKPDGEPLYGVQNLHGVSAALSLLTGQAQQYHAEMSERERLLNDETLPEITLSPLTVTPRVFMQDLIVPDALYDVRPSLCAYYGKQTIHIAGQEVQP